MVVGCIMGCSNPIHQFKKNRSNLIQITDENNEIHFVQPTCYNIKPATIDFITSKKISDYLESKASNSFLPKSKFGSSNSAFKTISKPPGLYISQANSETVSPHSESTNSESPIMNITLDNRKSITPNIDSDITSISRLTPIDLKNEQSYKSCAVSPVNRLESPKPRYSPTFYWNEVYTIIIEKNYKNNFGVSFQTVILGYNDADDMYHLFVGSRNELDRNSFDTASRGTKEDSANFFAINPSLFDKRNIIHPEKMSSFAFVIRYNSPSRPINLNDFENNNTLSKSINKTSRCSRFSKIIRVNIAEFVTLLNVHVESYIGLYDVNDKYIKVHSDAFQFIRKMIIRNLHITSQVYSITQQYPKVSRDDSEQSKHIPINTWRVY
jgi:hypothetical protein